MALVTRIISDCPQCRTKNSFGNISVAQDAVVRGCLFCDHRVRRPLPPVQKKILYLDQFFFSRAFRRRDLVQDKKYVEAVERLRQLAGRQVLIAPYSSIHEDETHQWAGDEAQTHLQLMEFIKQTSGGHEFELASSVQRDQVLAAFDRYMKREPVFEGIDIEDALTGDVHGWTDYFWIDVGGYLGDAARPTAAKKIDGRGAVAHSAGLAGVESNV